MQWIEWIVDHGLFFLFLVITCLMAYITGRDYKRKSKDVVLSSITTIFLVFLLIALL